MTYFMYKGKEYTNADAMPPDVRQAYTKWREEQNLPDDLLDFYESELRDIELENRGEKPIPPGKGTPTGHPFELLPSTCPQCGGPLSSENIQWSGTQSADCPYCGANLTMKK